MKTSFFGKALIAPMAALSLAGMAMAQDAQSTGGPKPKFAVLHPKPGADLEQPAVALPTWNGSYTYNGHTYNYTMVGTAPSTNTATSVKTYVIPVKIVIGSSTFDPSHVLTNGNTVIQNTVASPLFDKTTKYVQGGVNVGTTQYIDAYQRANFWGQVKTNTKYHLRLAGPTVMAEQTMTPPSNESSTGNAFGFTAGLVNINWFDAEAQTLLKTLKIPANSLPIFLTYDVYLSDNSGLSGCCIGGYHSYTGKQAYSMATYVDVVGAFSQNVSALSHEIGEWADDPLTNNNSACGILEVGDPLENNPNYGAYPYTLNGFTYDLQDLVTLPYFGAPASTSVNNWFTFQGESLTVCEHGS